MTLKGVRAGFTVGLMFLILVAVAEASARVRPSLGDTWPDPLEREFNESLWRMLAEVRRLTEEA